MTREEFLRDYWAYYLMLEKKFVHTLNYVSLHTDNESVFSNEYAALIQMIGAEMDSFFKVYCGFAASDNKNISHYHPIITNDYPGILSQQVRVRSADMSIIPFDGWNGAQPKQSLFWWLAFDNIKHSRTANKKDGSQKNALYLLAGLYLIEMKYLGKIAAQTGDMDIPDEKSELFSLPGWTFNYMAGNELVQQTIGDAVVLDGGDSSTN